MHLHGGEGEVDFLASSAILFLLHSSVMVESRIACHHRIDVFDYIFSDRLENQPQKIQ